MSLTQKDFLLLDGVEVFLKNNRFLDLTNDLSYKAFFEGEKQCFLLISFLDCALPLPEGSRVVKAIILNPEIYPEKLKAKSSKDKLGKTFILDLKIEFKRVINGHTYQELCNAEMQTTQTPHLLDRIVVYGGRLLSKVLDQGDDFGKLTNVYSILLTTENLKVFKDFEDDYHVGKLIREGSRPVVLSDVLTFTIIELKKFDKSLEELQTKRDCWLYFIKHSKELDVRACRILIEKGGVIMAEAISRLFEISKDSLLKEYEEARAKQQFDQSSREHAARQEGIEKGRIEIISQLLKANMSVEQICHITGLSKQEVLEIQKKTKI